jgi:outer membrane lipoprotein-sorting protein
MKKATILALAVLCALSASAAEMTVDDILTKNTAAKGGIEKLRALNGARFTGKISMGPMEAPFTMTKSRPENMRVEFTIQGMTGIQSYDGTTGWMVMPFMGKKDPEVLDADTLKEVVEQADFDGPFIDYAKKGNKVELLGKDKVEGTDTYKVKLTLKDGSESTVYFDAESFLEIKMEEKKTVQGQEIESETTLSNYQEVEGLTFPFSIESKAKGQASGQAFTIEKVELNPKIADGLYAMPKKAEVPAEPAKKQQ